VWLYEKKNTVKWRIYNLGMINMDAMVKNNSLDNNNNIFWLIQKQYNAENIYNISDYT